MKKRIFALAMLCVALCSVAQAATHTTTFGRYDFSQKGQTHSYDGDVSWTNDGSWSGFATMGAYFGWSGTKGVQFGSTSNYCREFSLTSSSFADMVVTKVTVNTSTGTDAVATCSVKVGESVYGTKSINTTPTDYEFTGNASGDVVVSWAQPETTRAMYVISITVEYEAAAGEVAAPVVSVSQNEKYNFDPVTVTMTAAEGASIYYTLDNTVPSEASTLYEGAFNITEDATIKAVAVKGGVVSPVSEPVKLTFGRSVADLAAFLALGTSDGFDTKTYVRVESDVTVIYHNSRSTYVTDGTTYLLLTDTYSYYKNDVMNNGDVIPGGFYGRFYNTTGIPQMNYLEGVAELKKGTPVAPIAMNVAAVTTADVNKYVVFRNSKTTAPEFNSFQVIQGENSLDAYNQFKVDMSGVNTENYYDVVGIIADNMGLYIYPIEFKESDATRVNAINAESTEQMYDLMGRKVADNTRGIVITKGKKVVIK